MTGFDVAVVGAGMAGCLAAFYLAGEGARVALIEAEDVGAGASGASAGGLNPLHGPGIPGRLSDLAAASFALHRTLWGELEGIGPAFHPRIVRRIFLAADASSLAGFERQRALYRALPGFTAEILDEAGIRAAEPRIAAGLPHALYTEGNAAVEPLPYVKAIAEAAERRGVTLIRGRAVGLDAAGGRAQAVRLADETVPAAFVVIATGARADAGDWLGRPIAVGPVKGEMLLVDLAGPPVLHDISLGEVSAYGRGGDGLLWIGVTESHEGFDNAPTDAARAFLMEGAARLMPALAGARIVGRSSGLRPVTPDNRPIVGRAPGWENVLLATGAGRKGTLLSAGMGRAVADLVLRGRTDVPVAGLEPERFG